MGLKQIIQRSKMFNREGIEAELELPGEPNIYSIKLNIAKRMYSIQFFRNMKFKSILKCFFLSYLKTNTPVVIVVKFYVSPPSHVKVSKRELNKETVPAVNSWELCDYLLSFMEMLHHVLINSYRQIVKIDAEKFYSSNPRTVFKFMSWSHYVMLQNSNPVHSSDKGENQSSICGILPADQPGNQTYEETCQETIR